MMDLWFLQASHKFWIAWTERPSMMQIRDCLRLVFENSDYSCSIKTLSSLLHRINLIPNLLSCVCFFFLCVQAFVIFCGLGINNTMMYNQVKKTWAKQSVALDVRPATYWSHQILLFFNHHFRRHLNIWCNIQCIIFCLCVFFCVCLWLFFLIVYCFFPPYFFLLLFIFFIILPLSLWLSKCDILYANYKR